MALAGLAMAVHLGFHAIDSRPAVDVGHTWTGVLAWLMGSPVDRPHGAYAWSVAIWSSVIGRTPWTFVLVDGVWTAVLAGAIAALSARVRPTMWVLGAAVLVMPMFPTIARTHWVHHPEAALAVLTLLAAEVVPVSVLGGLLLGFVAGFGASVRPSALVWVLPAILPWLGRGERRYWLALAPGLLLAADSVGAAAGYVGLRWSLRGENAAAVGDVWRLWPILTGIVPGLLLLALAGMGARQALANPVGRIGLFWAVGGVLVVAVTHAGPDNVPTVIVGLILVAAHARVPDRVAPAGALLLLGPLTLIPALDGLSTLSGWSSRDEPLNWLVPRADGISARKIEAAIALVCPPRASRPCRIVLERGFVHPSWEDDGALGLYLAGIDGVKGVPAHLYRDGADAAVACACRGEVPDPGRRFERVEAKFAALVAGRAPSAIVTGNGCTWTWYRLRD